MGKSPGRNRPQPKRRSHTNRWPYIAAAVVFVFLATVGRGLITQFLVQKYEAELGRMERTVELRGHLLWREEVITAPLSGQVSFTTRCGESVRAGTLLAEIYDPRTDAVIQRQVAQAQDNLTRFQAQAQDQAHTVEDSLHETTSQLVGAVHHARQLHGSEVAQKTEQLVGLLDRRRQQQALLAGLEEEEARLRAQLEGVRAQRSEAKATIVATMPGMVMHTIDGLEGTLQWERQESLTPRTLFTLSSSPSRIRDGESIPAGDAVLKLIDMREAVWAVATEEGKVDDLILGMRVTLRTDEGLRIQGRVTDVRYGSPPGYAVVLVSINEGVEQLGSQRLLEATVVKTASEGIRIPQSALWEKKGTRGVYVVYKTMVHFQPVDVLIIQDGWVLVLGLAAGDEVITTPRWVQEGQRVR